MKRVFFIFSILLFSLNSFGQIDSNLFCRTWVMVDADNVTSGESYTYIPLEQFDIDSTVYSYTTIYFDYSGGFSTKTNITEYADEQTSAYLTAISDGSYGVLSSWKISGNELEIIDTDVTTDDQEPVKYTHVLEIISLEKDKMVLKYLK